MTPGVLLVVALAGGAAKEPSYKVEVRKAADTVVARTEKDRTVFLVTSESGIGGADITLTGGAWPERVTLRFAYEKGKPFRSLEDIRLRTDRVVVQGAEKQSGRMRFCFVGADGGQDVIEPGGAEPAGYLDVRVRPGADGLDVTLPANLLRGSRQLRLSWIDAFRR
ncbi:hypothetical protein J0H58_06795 [bacterium]|nr:hypothetical protein [bacterium]